MTARPQAGVSKNKLVDGLARAADLLRLGERRRCDEGKAIRLLGLHLERLSGS